jgi:hypothetical protein
MAALAKLFSETPHAQRKQDERDDEEAYKIGPEMHEPASFVQIPVIVNTKSGRS